MCSVLVLDFIIAIFSSLDMTVPSNVAALKHLFRFYFYDSTHRYVVDRIHEQGNNSITGIKSKNTILPFFKKIGYKMMEKEREKEIIGSPEKENKNGVLNNFFLRYVQNENSNSLVFIFLTLHLPKPKTCIWLCETERAHWSLWDWTQAVIQSKSCFYEQHLLFLQYDDMVWIRYSWFDLICIFFIKC